MEDLRVAALIIEKNTCRPKLIRTRFKSTGLFIKVISFVNEFTFFFFGTLCIRRVGTCRMPNAEVPTKKTAAVVQKIRKRKIESKAV